ncbi:hypothetical protein D8674_011817 [Pyrus ussuriensis x Pyrus communis]|uniref:Retrotransposon gag domain-containing protein n=1 Tax=Pyrus ussuriensis x Pyrus communis TaxID=2448454 RepID=A0A5N5FZS3_9ROSA|nr:hypothetical protein D8674_011817 [Pyrus ussuriensis x Pyrus communis]
MPDIIIAIHALGEAQKESAASVKELKNSISKPSEKSSDKDYRPREKVSQEELAVATGKGPKKTPSFVTEEDVIAMLENDVLHMPYPKGYETLNLSFHEHISRIIDVLGLNVGDCNLCLMKFSKSLTDCAYTWYTTLAPGSIRTWEMLVGNFSREHSDDFCYKFLRSSFDCYDKMDEETLVEICISNIIADYRVYLENIGISQFSRFLEVIRHTNLSVEPSTGKSWKADKKKTYHA